MINIVTALRSEAHPIIEHLSLSPLETHRTPHIYGNDAVHLAISGVGLDKSPAAVERLTQFNAERHLSQHQAWLNIGIAGHRVAPLGSCFIVDKIVEQQTSKTFYPSIPYHTPIQSSSLCTVTKPEKHYRENSLYDMEGFSFFAKTRLYSALELIVLLKIVSDNETHPIERINKAAIKKLIENTLPTLDEMLSKLRNIIDRNFDYSPPPKIDWKAMWHTTYAQEQILEEWCHRLRLLNESVDSLALVAHCKNAQEAIRTLEETIKSMPLRLAIKQ